MNSGNGVEFELVDAFWVMVFEHQSLSEADRLSALPERGLEPEGDKMRTAAI